MTDLAKAVDALCADLAACGVRFALVGGLAVSVRTEPRFTRDVDVVAEIAPNDIDAVARQLAARGHAIEARMSDAADGHVAGIRLRRYGIREDVLLAFSGLEAETCASAERIEVLPGVVVPVASTAHLIVLKLIAIVERDRMQDRADAEALATCASKAERDEVASLLTRVRSAHGTRPERLAEIWQQLAVPR